MRPADLDAFSVRRFRSCEVVPAWPVAMKYTSPDVWEWVQDEGSEACGWGGPEFLVVIGEPGASYNPFQESSAFARKLARVPLSSAGISEFALEHGALEYSHAIAYRRPGSAQAFIPYGVEEPEVPLGPGDFGSEGPPQSMPHEDGDVPLSYGVSVAPLGRWLAVIRQIREALDTWDSIRENETVKLDQRFREAASHPPSAKWARPPGVVLHRRWWSGSPRWRLWHELSAGLNPGVWMAHSGDGREGTGDWAPRDPRDSATSVLDDIIRPQLERRVRRWLHWWSPEDRIVLRDQASDLCSGIWLQLAQAITLGLEHRRCLQCGTWFAIDPSNKHQARKRLCSQLCNGKAYRERKAEAVRLRMDGLTPAAIAKQLASDTETVRGWVRDVRPAKKPAAGKKAAGKKRK
jgi:hypothetical protein